MLMYVVYVLSDYACAVFMTTDKAKAQKQMRKLKDRGLTSYIERYDFSVSDNFELECD